MTASDDDLDAIRRRVLNVIGHELRTPATTLRGLADRLAEADAEEIRAELAPALQRNAIRLEQLVDDLLVAAGVATALPVFQPEPTPVNDALAEAWGQLGGGPGLTVAGEVLDHAHVHHQVLTTILARVLDNYRKYASYPTEVGVQRQDDRLVIMVEAGGVEPHPEELRLALEPFFRGEGAVTSAPGLGLGLSVARSLLRHVGGDITFELRPEGGTRTTVVVPAVPVGAEVQ